jgi:hypothetical protein
MRYSLFLLLALVTLLAACFAMYVPHGLFGVVLLLPHAVIVGLIARFFRRARWLLALTGAVAYVVLWISTWVFGIAPSREHVIVTLSQTGQRYPDNFSSFARLDYDPIRSSSADYVEPPWKFFGNESSPCPFVVTVDYGIMVAPMFGGGGKVYVVWFFGYTWEVKTLFYWSS